MINFTKTGKTAHKFDKKKCLTIVFEPTEGRQRGAAFAALRYSTH